MFELRQSSEHAAYLKKKGLLVERHPDTNVYAYLTRVPLIPVTALKLQRVPFKVIDFDWLKKLRRKHRVVVSYLELLDHDFDQSALAQQGYLPSKSAMLMTKTLRVDISQSEKDLLQQMKQKTRYNIKVAQKHGLTAKVIPLDEVLQQLELFDSIMKIINDNAKRIKVFLFSKKDVRHLFESFAHTGFMVTIHAPGSSSEILAVATYLIAGDTAYYSHNGSTLVGRQQMAPTLAIWAGIRESQQRGLNWFDFDGINDERFPTKRWEGFTRFKLGFGGQEIVYPPAYKKGWL